VEINRSIWSEESGNNSTTQNSKHFSRGLQLVEPSFFSEVVPSYGRGRSFKHGACSEIQTFENLVPVGVHGIDPQARSNCVLFLKNNDTVIAPKSIVSYLYFISIIQIIILEFDENISRRLKDIEIEVTEVIRMCYSWLYFAIMYSNFQ